MIYVNSGFQNDARRFRNDAHQFRNDARQFRIDANSETMHNIATHNKKIYVVIHQ